MKSLALVLRVVIIGAVLAIGGGLYWWKTHPAGPASAGFEPAETVRVVQAGTAKWRPTAELVGTVFALRSVTVSNEVAGVVKEVRFDSGTVVQQGDPLLILDTSTEEADLQAAQAAVRVAEANVESAAANLRLAESSARRMNEAAAQRAVAAMEVDKSRSELDAAKAASQRMDAELAQARAHVEQVRTIIQKKRIVAPFKARAGMRTIHPGQYLKEGTEIVTLQGIDDHIYLDFALPQEEAWRVKPGETFMITSRVLGAEPMPIKVVALDAQASMTTRNIRIRGIIENTNEALRPGMSVEVNVPIGESREYVVAPSVAIRRATYGDFVFVIAPSTKDGEQDKLRAAQRQIKLGPAIGQDVVVVDGLKAGERIAAEGSFKLRDGALVMEGGAEPGAPTPTDKSDQPAESTASSKP